MHPEQENLKKIKEDLSFFTTYYSILVAIFFSIVGFPQFLKPHDTMSAENISSLINTALNMPTKIVMIKAMYALFISSLLVLPVVALWYFSGSLSRLLTQLQDDTNRSGGDPLNSLSYHLLLPMLVWFGSFLTTIGLSFSVGSYNGSVFWLVIFLIPVGAFPFYVFRQVY